MYNEQSEDKRRKRLIILILLLLLLIVFGLITLYKTGTLSKINNEVNVTAPKITKGSSSWKKDAVVKVEVPSKSEEKISYYEYCIGETKDTKNCNWTKTLTSSVELSKTGTYYVTFRGVTEEGKISKISNQEEIRIDNTNPVIEKIDKLEITKNSIKIYVHASDTGSGVSKYLYSLDGVNYVEGNKEYTYTGLNENTEYEIYVKVVDEVGNEVVVIETVKTLKKEKETIVTPTKPSKTDNKKDDKKEEEKKDEEKEDNKEEVEPSNPENPNEPSNPEKPSNPENPNEPSNPEEPTKPELPEEPEWDTPTISLSDVPGFMVEKSSYKLPSNYDFGNDTGTVSCEIEGTKYTDTKELSIGSHTIKCEAVSSHNKKAEVEKEVLIEEEDIYDEPTIDLEDVPEVITIGDLYKLPSNYDFGNDTGKVKCVVGEVEYTNTSELEIGTHKIECTVISSHNKEAKVEKEIEVEPEWDTPLIDLDEVPDLITIGTSYTLPSHYDFGNDEGTTKCVVDENEYTNTSELEVGTHKIECTATSKHNKEAKVEKEIEVEPVWDIPQINLEEVPNKFTYGEEYELPSFYDFGNDTGNVECIVEGIKYTNTSEIKTGRHLIVCTATSRHNKKTMVTKEVEITYTLGLSEEFDGWVKLNLFYPEGSYNWEWRLGREDEIRTGYDNDGWQEYTGPILVKIDDVENVYIRYEVDGVTYIVAPNGSLVVDIAPSRWTVEEGQTTLVKITYDKTAKVKEYRINGGEWIEYTSSFSVGTDTLIEARAIRPEKVYDNHGDYQYTQNIMSVDTAYISEYIPKVSSYSGTGGGGTIATSPMTVTIKDPVTQTPRSVSISTPSEGVEPPTVIDGPTISVNPTTIAESVYVTITTEYPARKIYYSEKNGSYKEYTGPFEVKENERIYAYYIRESDGIESKTTKYYVGNVRVKTLPYISIEANPDYLSEKVDKVDVTISCEYCDTLEYSLDGEIYSEYTNKIEVRESKTIYARATNIDGTRIEKREITTNNPPKPQDKLEIYISTDPDPEGLTELVNKATVKISYDKRSEKQYYRLSKREEWREYTGEFEVTKNTTVYAYCTSENGYGKKEYGIGFLTTGIPAPTIMIEPEDLAAQTKVEIEYHENAIEKKYKIGEGEWEDYNGPFYVYENTIIYAYNKDVLNNEAETSRTINSVIIPPNYITLDDLNGYFIMKLNYPEVSSTPSREYKWKESGEWKVYDPKGILLIKPEYRDVINADVDGVRVLDKNGNEVLFEDHYYVVDIPLSEISENIFMRWNTGKPDNPIIHEEPSDIPTKEAEISITYDSTSYYKYYKIVPNDLEDYREVKWEKYTGPITINQNNVTIFARGMNRVEIDSEIVKYEVTNIDEEVPTLTIDVDLETPKHTVTVTVISEDDQKIDVTKYEKGRKDKEYFKSNGKIVGNNGIVLITEDGIYTFYTRDKVGNEVIKEIEVGNVIDVYEVTFNSNGGENVPSMNVDENTKIGALPTTTKYGYTFDGWYTSVEGGEKITPNTVITGPITYYAHYVVKNYTVTFDSNGGSEALEKVVQEGKEVGILPTSTKLGYTFAGWWTSKTGGNKIEETTKVTQDITYYAHWETKKYTVAFFTFGGSEVASIEVQEGEKVGSLPTSTKYGYTLRGWYTDPVLGEQITEDTVILEDTMFYALWNIKYYTVTFDSNGGSEVAPIEVQEGEEIGTLPTSTLTGYDLTGWWTSKTGGNKIEETTKVTGNVTYYGQWEIKKYTVTFNTHGGTSVEERKVQEGQPIGILPNSTKPDYVLLGWYTEEENGEEITKDTVILSDVTYHAVWKESLLGRVVFFDPVSEDTCNASTYDIGKIRNNTSTCYRWRIISQDEEKYNLQLDYNFINSAFSYSGEYTHFSGPTALFTNLANATSTWTRVPLLNYTYDSREGTNYLYAYGVLTCTDGTCTASKRNNTVATNVRARIITADEIVNLMNMIAEPTAPSQIWNHNTNSTLYFSNTGKKIGTNTNGTGNVSLAWLLDNMTSDSSSYASSNSYGNDVTQYWTLTFTTNGASNNVHYYPYVVNSSGYIAGKDGASASTSGVRPVIQLTKEQLGETSNLGTSAKQYVTITYNTQGGNNIADRVMEPYKRYDSLPKPVKEGYTFMGWFTEEVNGTQIFPYNYSPNSDVTYYAHWYDNSILGKVVFYDPVSEDTCNASTYDVEKIMNNTSTCYRWRIIGKEPSNNNYKLLLDHNIGNAAYGSSGEYSYHNGPVYILTTLANLTSTWTRVPLLNYRYDSRQQSYPYGGLYGYGVMTCTNGTCVASQRNNTVATNVRARIITADEVVEIMNTVAEDGAASKSWTHNSTDTMYFSNTGKKIGTNTNGTGNTTLAWLIDNTTLNNTSGASSNTFGNDVSEYWTMTNTTYYANNVQFYPYAISKDGQMYPKSSTNSASNGIRPVIELSTVDMNEAGSAEKQYVTIKFNTQGGNNIADRVMEPYKRYDSLPKPVKEGYTFMGWFTEEVNGTQIFPYNYSPGSDVTYYAHWYDNSILGKVVYYDPVSEDTCNASTYNAISVKNNTSTCYRWRIIGKEPSNNNYKLQLDHNLGSAAYGSSGEYSYYNGPVYILTTLANLTSTWTRVPLLNYRYDSRQQSYPYGGLYGYGVMTCTNGTCVASQRNNTVATNVRARIITADEVVEIMNTVAEDGATSKSWTHNSTDTMYFSNTGKKIGTNTNGTGNTTLAWLIDNTTLNNTSGASSNTFGNDVSEYWTMTNTTYYANNVQFYPYAISKDGQMYPKSSTNSASNGIRPVIELSTVDMNETESAEKQYVTIKFNTQGGNDIADRVMEPYKRYDSLPKPVKEGYTFMGWFTDSVNGIQIFPYNYSPNGNVTYYAHWYDNSILGRVVYYDPVSTNTCNATTYDVEKIINNTSTCYRWRIIGKEPSNNNYKLQLDHNLGSAAYGSSGEYSYYNGPVYILTTLASLTSTWTRVPLLNYRYDSRQQSYPYGGLYGYGVMTCTNGTCVASQRNNTVATNVRARIITADEVVEIMNTVAEDGAASKSWTHNSTDTMYFSNTGKKIGTNTNGTGNTTLAWLIDNTTLNNTSGASNNTFGSDVSEYWTMTNTTYYANNVEFYPYVISKDGQMYPKSSRNTYSNGIRPVIEVSTINMNETESAEKQYVTIKFNTQGGNSIDDRVMEPYKKYNTLPTPEKEGNTFIGWFTDPLNGTKILESNFSPRTDVTYYAHWHEDSLLGKLVYYDPASTNSCNANTYTGNNTCYKWRVIETETADKTNLKIQMDHNLVSNGNWNSSNTINQGPTTVLTALATATSSWTRVPYLTYEYDTSASSYSYGLLNCTNGECTVNNQTISNVRARIITGEEVVDIVKTETDGTTIADNWSLSTGTEFYINNSNYIIGTQTAGTNTGKLAWLIENGLGGGRGYKTLSPAYVVADNAVIISYGNVKGTGRDKSFYKTTTSLSEYGARPVITVPKADLSY